MSNGDQMKYAEEKWREAVRKNEFYDVMYWRGYIDGLKAQNPARHVLAELYQAMGRDGR